MLGLAALGAVIGLKAYSKGTSGTPKHQCADRLLIPPLQVLEPGYNHRQGASALMCQVLRSAVSQDTVHSRLDSVLQPVQQHAAHPKQGAPGKEHTIWPHLGTSGVTRSAAAHLVILFQVLSHRSQRATTTSRALHRWPSPLCQRRPSSYLASWRPAPPLFR